MDKGKRVTKRSNRAFTLVEMMIVIVLVGLLAAATAVAVFHTFATGQDKTTRIAANGLRNAAATWRTEHPNECPTGAILREAKMVDRGGTITDAWGTPFAIVCEPDDITIVSFGPDRQENTPDDMRIPPPV